MIMIWIYLPNWSLMLGDGFLTLNPTLIFLGETAWGLKPLVAPTVVFD
jgi:hypothetical protein